MAGWTGLEPATSDVTGRRSNQLNYHPSQKFCNKFTLLLFLPKAKMVGGTGLEPVTPAL